jgi:hypothetical protein
MSERTTVRLPANLISRAKGKAMAEGRTLTSLIEEGLRRATSEPAPQAQEDWEPLPVSSAGGGLTPGLDWEDSKGLQDLEDIEARRRLS